MIRHRFDSQLSEKELLQFYQKYSSRSAIYTPNPNTAKPHQVLPAISPNNVKFSLLTEATEGGAIRGDGFQLDAATGLFLATRDMFQIDVCLYATASWLANDNICIGVGVGLPNNFPQYPGEDARPKPYISRFFSNTAGSNSRIVTISLTQGPIGRNTTQGTGILQGDYIFPAIWTTETDQSSIDIYDLIMTVTEIPYYVQ